MTNWKAFSENKPWRDITPILRKIMKKSGCKHNVSKGKGAKAATKKMPPWLNKKAEDKKSKK